MFNENELNLLKAAYQALIGRTHVFDVLGEKKWENTGIEYWVQTELIVALIDRDYDVTTTGKIRRGCDIIVNDKKSGPNIGVEIKAFTSNWYTGLVDGIEKHPKADVYFFLCKSDNDLLKQLDSYFSKNGYIEEHRTFNDWMIMLVKKV